MLTATDFARTAIGEYREPPEELRATWDGFKRSFDASKVPTKDTMC